MLAKIAGQYRAELIIQSTIRATLHQELNRIQQKIPTLASAKTVKWVLEIDPIE